MTYFINSFDYPNLNVVGVCLGAKINDDDSYSERSNSDQSLVSLSQGCHGFGGRLYLYPYHGGHENKRYDHPT